MSAFIYERSFTFRSLTVSYDPAVKDTLSTGIEIHEGYKLSLSFFGGEGGTNREWRYEYISDSFNDMITDTSAYSCMDLLASIDRSSIVTSGEDVSFSAVTPEGQTLRFAGKNMEIGENSLVIQPGGYLCSLDSIGPIYGFDAEYPVPDEYDNCLMPGYAYTFDDSKLSVSSADDLVKWSTTAIYDSRSCGYIVGQRAFLPNFVYVSASEFMGAVEANELKIYYDPSVKTAGIKELKLDESWYGYALEGEKYDASKEKSADMASNNMVFYLLALPDTEYGSENETVYTREPFNGTLLMNKKPTYDMNHGSVLLYR